MLEIGVLHQDVDLLAVGRCAASVRVAPEPSKRRNTLRTCFGLQSALVWASALVGLGQARAGIFTFDLGLAAAASASILDHGAPGIG